MYAEGVNIFNLRPARPDSSHRIAPAAARAGGPRRQVAGFTILEVAVASCIMAMGIATSIIAMQSGFKQIEVARGNTLASQIIQSEMERLRLMPWNNTSTGAVDSICELPASENVDLSSMFSSSANLAARFTVTRTVTADGSRPNDVRTITIRVQWTTFDGISHNRSFSSIYVKNGLYDYYYTLAH
jgi:Tfp pilus assembly protein PilV